ncbi:MAG: bifunctional phosphoribosyl-AMP cyclohydrolase/phosphoribosyl-ATP diphosphatase HisIE [Clostridia bacterium]|nr:bifunctional phosphoribosyl-AMP cyclohydrolase/phosphoribosyl-ATP diphosphatase HisIE [Clostridia bacterium]
MLKIDELKFDQNGLIPAVVQDYCSKEVLTVAYMNRESLEISIEEQKTCFFSRSRKELWRKGETSGNFQHIVAIKADCDRDALVVEVKKDGPACHLGNESCFCDYVFVSEEIKSFSLEELYKMLEGRKAEKIEGSYTSYLFEKGIDKILKKVGEECTEVIIAGKGNEKEETVFEISDLVYHILVLMIEMKIPLSDVFGELSKRHIVDHKVKQEKMK